MKSSKEISKRSGVNSARRHGHKSSLYREGSWGERRGSCRGGKKLGKSLRKSVERQHERGVPFE